MTNILCILGNLNISGDLGENIKKYSKIFKLI